MSIDIKMIFFRILTHFLEGLRKSTDSVSPFQKIQAPAHKPCLAQKFDFRISSNIIQVITKLMPFMASNV